MEAAETKEQPNQAYTFRPYTADDIPFVHRSWGTTYYEWAGYRDLLSPNEFHSHHRPIRERFFQHPGAAIIVCCSKEEPTQILAWMAIEKPPMAQGLILHYIYTKNPFRDQGIATELIGHLKDKPIMFTHLTDRASKIMDSKYAKFKDFFYMPHLT